MKFSWEWAAVFSIITTLIALATFWEKLGRVLWKSALWPVFHYVGCFVLLPVRVERLAAGLLEVKETCFSCGGAETKEKLQRVSRDAALASEYQRAMFTVGMKPMFLSDKDGKCIQVNRAYYRLFGRSLEELIGWGWTNFVNEKFRKDVKIEWIIAVKEERDFEMMYTIHCSEGDQYKLRCLAVPIRLDGKFIGHLGVLHDVELVHGT